MKENIIIVLCAIFAAIVLFVLIRKRKKILGIFRGNSNKEQTAPMQLYSDDEKEHHSESERNPLLGDNEFLNTRIIELEKDLGKIEDLKTMNSSKEEEINAYAEEISRLKNEIEIQKQSFQEKINENLIKVDLVQCLKTELENKDVENRRLLEKTEEIEQVASSKKRGFKVQSLITAGPRKTTRDNELGEDVIGFTTKGDDLFFWVLDGTSDEGFIEIDNVGELFSCRKLAVQISHQLGENALNDKYKSIENWVEHSIKNVLEDWRESISKYFVHIENQINKVATFKTTIAVGKWNSSTKKLEVFRIGDSKIVAFNNLEKVDLFKYEKKDQVTFQIQKKGEKLEVIDFDNSDTLEIVSATDIEGIIAFSDGLSKTSEKLIAENFKKWDDVVINKKQLTNDDKALLIANIVE